MDGGPFQKRGCGTHMRAPTSCPLFRTSVPSVPLTAPTNLRRSLRNVVGTHRVPGSWTTRVHAGSLRSRTMLNSPLPNQPIITCTPGPVQSTLPSCSQAKRPLEQPRQRLTTRNPFVGSRSIHSCYENLASCLVRSPGWRIVQGRAQQSLGLPLLVVVWCVVCVPYRACMHQFALGGYLPIDCCSRASAATGPFCDYS
jgi:hypothetical protein